MAGGERWWVWVVPAALLLAGAGAWELRDAGERQASARSALEQVRSRRAAAAEARALLTERLPRYRQWVERGVIADPASGEVAWAAALRRLAGSGGYRIEEAVPFDEAAGVWRRSATVRLTVPHEGVLLERMARFRGTGVGRVRLEGCRLTRTPEAEVSGECRLSRLTLDPGEGAP